MRVFLTGGSGFVGSAVIRELVAAGHHVTGLARSDEAARKLEAAGVGVHRGELTDPASLHAGAAASDGVIHCAFSHDDSADRAGNCLKDRTAIEAIGTALAGSDRPFVLTSGTGRLPSGAPITELDLPPLDGDERGRSEHLALAFAERGVRVSCVRLPPSVHGEGDHGFVPMLIDLARKTGRSGYIGDGSNRWPAVHRLDAALAFRLALEQAPVRTVLNAVGEEGIPTRAIAEAIGARLGLPVESVAADHFSWLGRFFALDLPVSSQRTRERFAWTPAGVGLLADLENGTYFR